MITDPDLAKVGAALQRAAAKARQLGVATKTPVYVYRDGNIVNIVDEHPQARLPKNATAKSAQRKTTSRPGKTQSKKSR